MVKAEKCESDIEDATTSRGDRDLKESERKTFNTERVTLTGELISVLSNAVLLMRGILLV